jgi:hypothetical protein
MAALGVALSLLVPVTSVAADPGTPAAGIVIGNGTIQLGVTDSGGLGSAGIGLQYLPTSTDVLGGACQCQEWTLDQANPPLVERFEATRTGVVSVVRVHDSCCDAELRVTHDFRPSVSANLYEVLVTVENLGPADARPGYRRFQAPSSSVASQPQRAALELPLPLLEAGATHTFRLYMGAADSPSAAVDALAMTDATLVSESPSASAGFLFAYAQGAAPADAGGGSEGSTSSGGTEGSRSTSGGIEGKSATSSGGSGEGLVIAGRPGTPKAPNPGTDDSMPPVARGGDVVNPPTRRLPDDGRSSERPKFNPFDLPGDRADGPPVPTHATPELDTLALFGTGLLGTGAYLLRARRVRRSTPRTPDADHTA